MPNGDVAVCDAVRSTLTSHGVFDKETDIQHATKFDAKSGQNRASLLVYNSGRMTVQGAESPLRDWLTSAKDSIASGSQAPGVLLPAEIEKFPQTLLERVPDCDGVIVWCFQEAMRCYKSGNTAAAAFMLGAASEKAILLLVDVYAQSIKDEAKRSSFQSRVNGKAISRLYDEFKRSQKSAKTQPDDPSIARDLDQYLDGAFNFYRITRNGVGHPQVIPDLDPGVVLANMGQFIIYVERTYDLQRFFRDNGTEV